MLFPSFVFDQANNMWLLPSRQKLIWTKMREKEREREREREKEREGERERERERRRRKTKF
jgi:hypothetical protein